MTQTTKPKIVVLGSNFGGMTTARFLRKALRDKVDITVIDKKSNLLFVPNIPETVMSDKDPQNNMHLQFLPFYERDKTRFIQAEVKSIDPETQTVEFTPNERPGEATEKIRYDYLVVALGCRLAYDEIEGFTEYGSTVSDCYYGNKFREYIWGGHYKGGPIAIGSARFHQRTTNRPAWLPTLTAACEGPVMEMSMLLATWLRKYQHQKTAERITMFTPGKILGEDAGLDLATQFANLAEGMGESIKYDTQDIKRLTADGVEFANGDSLDAEIKIVLPDWKTHDFLKPLPITDDMGFVVTDKTMRNPKYRNIFAVGDCAAVTVPKLGAIGDAEARVTVRQICDDLGVETKKFQKELDPVVICWGTMGDDKAFYLHTNKFYGGDTGYLKIGHLYYMMKMSFKAMYFETGGTPPPWGLPLAELVGDHW
jgi:sulfide:quinone oxidoreductase